VNICILVHPQHRRAILSAFQKKNKSNLILWRIYTAGKNDYLQNNQHGPLIPFASQFTATRNNPSSKLMAVYLINANGCHILLARQATTV
jgi:hypothetical protein